MVRNGDYGLYDFFRNKLMFPIFNPKGQIIAFSGRSLDGSEPKYINTTDTEFFHKRYTIFGFNFAREEIYKKNRSIIVEGQIDAIQMQCNGFGETVAPLGTALTEDHIALLCKSNRNIIFCFDGDNAGQKAAARACSLVLPFIRDNSDVRFAFVTGGKDPDEVLKTSGKEFALSAGTSLAATAIMSTIFPAYSITELANIATPLIFTSCTCHMITSFVFFCIHLTSWTSFYSFTFRPIHKLLFYLIIT